jgi:uncharacterized protein (TIGR04255 family)
MKFDIGKVPKKITPCPIEEAVIELRFESDLPAEVIPGLLFNEFKADFPNIEKLGMLEMPSFIRDTDPNLRFAPLHSLNKDNLRLQIGPRSLSLACSREYIGWTKFNEIIQRVFDGVAKVSLIKKPLRIGLRYISFFEKIDIFEKSKTNLMLAENSLVGSKNILRSEFDFMSFICVIQMNNSVTFGEGRNGSVIDIDVLRDLSGVSNNVVYKNVIDEAHEVEKKIFFSLLKEDYLKQFKPEY